MALAIGVSVGAKIKIGDDILQVKSMDKPNLIIVSINGGKDLVISEQASVEILPRVFVFAGVSKGGVGMGNRLAFEAPRSIRIERVPEGYQAELKA